MKSNCSDQIQMHVNLFVWAQGFQKCIVCPICPMSRNRFIRQLFIYGLYCFLRCSDSICDTDLYALRFFKKFLGKIDSIENGGEVQLIATTMATLTFPSFWSKYRNGETRELISSWCMLFDFHSESNQWENHSNKYTNMPRIG